MRSILNYILLITCTSLWLTSCDKVGDLPQYQKGTTPILITSASTIAPQAVDSNNTVMTLSWTYPDYATDYKNIKYIVEIDAPGNNFSKPFTRVVMGNINTSFTAKELNAILLGYGFAFNVPVDMDVRVISSYANNNERLVSNAIKVKMTPYKIPPKIALPASGKLFIVGGATNGGWNNPVPVPTQELSKIDETTFGGIFQLAANQSYLLLPVNGDWGAKYGAIGSNNSNNPIGDDFKLGGGDLIAPVATGVYKIIVNFQTGKFTVTPYSSPVPDNLFIVGDATAGGWTNPVPTPSQQLTRLNSSEFKITLPLTGGKEYLLLPVNGDWGHKYSVADNTLTNLWKGGEFGYDLSKNFPGPPTSGTYTITVNFAAPTTVTNSVGKFTVQ